MSILASWLPKSWSAWNLNVPDIM
uniref:Uncharacterized protein n=1 Tax=Rhizophora mucronata TaxID=61149 RepID=A0A2P2PY66_RHIMU